MREVRVLLRQGSLEELQNDSVQDIRVGQGKKTGCRRDGVDRDSAFNPG